MPGSCPGRKQTTTQRHKKNHSCMKTRPWQYKTTTLQHSRLERKKQNGPAGDQAYRKESQARQTSQDRRTVRMDTRADHRKTPYMGRHLARGTTMTQIPT
ncbi:hypothetical protein DPMN_174316 [Dreissena polymorpha]|uniref:Uncharacterized protein n=1 Tax=Dreissena polymorpha TaxID=45954 RepID=A0A9D4IIG7_DREPO|nr:hypothetical protein DPMN_174316 [Dreissena polymorpha]